jgi:hypothetical protein
MLRFGWETMVKRSIPRVAANVDDAGRIVGRAAGRRTFDGTG